MAHNLRARTSRIKPQSYAVDYEDMRSSRHEWSDANAPPLRADAPWIVPVYRIDLSLPPIQRYVQVARQFHSHLHDLPFLFDDLCDAAKVSRCVVHILARILLHRVYSKEQTEELRGISQTVGLPLYLLIAYNVLLDLFMGCTSGGALMQPPEFKTPRMMHFRTLDWGMPELRDVLVQYDFVEMPGGDVIARTISYVGFVGVLTGLRKGLSVSINFRPYHNNNGSFSSNLKFCIQQLAVLLGFRPSIASILRDFILPCTNAHEIAFAGRDGVIKPEAQPVYGPTDICTTLPSISTTVAYLIFCTGDETFILEKDRKTARILKAPDFIAVTNHDVSYDIQADAEHTKSAHAAHVGNAFLGGKGMQDIVDESIDRKGCLTRKWQEWSRSSHSHSRRFDQSSRSGPAKGVPLEAFKEWMQQYPTSNEQTHFVCIMDPATGLFRWVKKYEDVEIQSQRRQIKRTRPTRRCKHSAA